mmetsp:Transcript_23667/g.55706  ORF Transcript_23667/g.55706 Transcript_23667/m.55706 type:complete len:89 (-) Transcript_23667:1132-1398(-)
MIHSCSPPEGARPRATETREKLPAARAPLFFPLLALNLLPDGVGPLDEGKHLALQTPPHGGIDHPLEATLRKGKRRSLRSLVLEVSLQ